MLRILLLLCLTSPLLAQTEYKLAAAGKTIEFKEIDRLRIVGGSGSDLVIGGQGKAEDRDERAVGLRKISAIGLKDNTGFGLSVTEADGRILVQQVGGESRNEVTIRVPNSARVVVEQTTHRGGDLEISDFGGDLDVSVAYHRVTLKNVTGAVAVNTLYDEIVASWDANPTKEVRLHSTYDDVDVTLPAAAKANVRLSTGYGSMYTDFDIQIKANTTAAQERQRGDDDETEKVAPGALTGTINGGGPLMSLTATYQNLYIRKK